MELKETDHNYYCSESNYYKNGCLCQYDTWDDFRSAWLENDNTIDCDYNLCFRYDINQGRDEETDELLPEYSLWLFFMQQRKGAFIPVVVTKIEEKDIPEIEQFLKYTW